MTPTLEAASGGEQIDDILDGFVGAVIGGFELAVWLVFGVRLVVEAAVGERSAEALMKEQEEQRYLHALGAEAVGVARPVPVDEAVPLELAQVVAQLVEAVGFLGKMEARQHGLVDLPGGRAADLRAGVQENLEEPDEARVVDLDAGVTHRADGDG